VESTLITAGFVVAVAAAARSTWSPCGLSMLSSITPMGDAGRGQRFRTTAAWFVVGATAGGATLGAAGAALAEVVSASRASAGEMSVVAAAACALAAAWDLGILGLPMPVLRRQVNELWLDRYRGWVYGAGFGWQIGVGFATYIMTAGVIALVPLAASTGSPLAALAIGTTFGTFRGATVLLGRSVTSTEALLVVHRRLDRFARPVRLAVAALIGAVGLGIGVASTRLLTIGVSLLVVAGAGVVARLLLRRKQGSPVAASVRPTKAPARRLEPSG
jgi:hypothetical protein